MRGTLSAILFLEFVDISNIFQIILHINDIIMGVGGGVESYFGVLLMAKPKFWVLALAQV